MKMGEVVCRAGVCEGSSDRCGHSSVQTVLIELRKWLVQALLGRQYSFSLDKSRSWKLKEQLIAWALYVVSHSITLQTAVPSKKTPKILSQCKRKINFQRGINCVVCPHPCPLVLPLEIFRTGLSLCNRTFCSWLEEHRKRTWWQIISILPQMETQGHWLLSPCLRNLTGQIFQILISFWGLERMERTQFSQFIVDWQYTVARRFQTQTGFGKSISSRKRCGDIISMKCHWWDLPCSPKTIPLSMEIKWERSRYRAGIWKNVEKPVSWGEPQIPWFNCASLRRQKWWGEN